MNQEQRDAAHAANEDPGWRDEARREEGLRFCLQSGSDGSSGEPKAPTPIEDAKRLLDDLRSGRAQVRRDDPETGNITLWGTEAVRTAAEELVVSTDTRRLDILERFGTRVHVAGYRVYADQLAEMVAEDAAVTECREAAQTHDNDEEDNE